MRFLKKQWISWEQFTPGKAIDRSSHRAVSYALFFLVAVVFCLAAGNASANMPMAFVFTSGKAIYWWASLIALLLEFVAIRWIFGISWRKALLASFVVNVSTLVLGVSVYRYALAWIYVSLLVAPGSLADVAGSLLLVSLIDTAVELAVLGLFFSTSIGWRRALAFFIVNAVSAGIILFAPLASTDERFDTIPTAELQELEEYYALEIVYMDRIGEALIRTVGFAEIAQEAETRSAERHLDQSWLTEQRTKVDAMRFHEISIQFRSKHPPENENEPWRSWRVYLATNLHDMYSSAMYGYRGDGCSELSAICYSRISIDYDLSEKGIPSAKFEGYLATKSFENDDYYIDIEAKLPGDFRGPQE